MSINYEEESIIRSRNPLTLKRELWTDYKNTPFHKKKRRGLFIQVRGNI